MFVLFTFLTHRFLPKYDVRMQLLMFQIKMLRDRIDDQRIVPTPEERAELLRLRNEVNHDIADVMLVVKPQTYRRWLSPKAKTRSPKPAGRPGTAEDIVALILRMATENLSWGYKRIFGELKKLGLSVGLTTIRDILKRSDCSPPPEKTKSRLALPRSKFVSAAGQRFLRILHRHLQAPVPEPLRLRRPRPSGPYQPCLARLLPHPAAPPGHCQQRHLRRFPPDISRSSQTAGTARRHRCLVRAGSGVNSASSM
jgi:putative transposase